MTTSRLSRLDGWGTIALCVAIAAATLLALTQLAHADPVAATGVAPVTLVLGWPEYLALILAALGGVRMVIDGLLVILRAVAPRTRTTLDDGFRDGLQVVHDKIDSLAGLLQSVVAGLRDRPAEQPLAGGKPVLGLPSDPKASDGWDDWATKTRHGILRLARDESAEGDAPGKRDPQAGRSRTGLLLTLAATVMVVVGVVALLGCTPGQRAGAGQRVASGLVAALDCEAAHIDADLLADATKLAGATVQRWFGDQGAPDDEARAQIKADLAPLKSDLVRCAIAGAVAAIVHRPTQPQGLITSALSAPGPDPELVRLEIQAAARELGWAPVVVGGEVL